MWPWDWPHLGRNDALGLVFDFTARRSFVRESASHAMSLPISSREYVGRLLCFKPGYGWGWSRLDKSGDEAFVDYAEVERAGSFYIRIHRFFRFQGELRGAVGRVEQPGHMFHGMWAATWTMLVGEFDFVEKLCHRWDIELGPVEPSGDDWPQIDGVSPAYSGYGILAVSQDALARFFESLR